MRAYGKRAMEKIICGSKSLSAILFLYFSGQEHKNPIAELLYEMQTYKKSVYIAHCQSLRDGLARLNVYILIKLSSLSNGFFAHIYALYFKNMLIVKFR
jgi:hypothetical protein